MKTYRPEYGEHYDRYRAKDEDTKQASGETVAHLVERLTDESEALVKEIDTKARYLKERHELATRIEAQLPMAGETFKNLTKRADLLAQIARYGAIGQDTLDDLKHRLLVLQEIATIEILVEENGSNRRATMREVRSRLRHLQKIDRLANPRKAEESDVLDIAEAA
jgi:hypothetical protein